MHTFSICYNIPSQNTRDGWHWSERGRDTKRAETMIRVTARGVPRASGKRKLHLVSYRRQRFHDDANYRGGAKGITDAIVRAGLLVDDRDSLAAITYEQHTLSQMPPDLANKYNGRPCTVISLEDFLCL